MNGKRTPRDNDKDAASLLLSLVARSSNSRMSYERWDRQERVPLRCHHQWLTRKNNANKQRWIVHRSPLISFVYTTLSLHARSPPLSLSLPVSVFLLLFFHIPECARMLLLLLLLLMMMKMMTGMKSEKKKKKTKKERQKKKRKRPRSNALIG